MSRSHFCLLRARFVFKFDSAANLQRRTANSEPRTANSEPRTEPEHELRRKNQEV